MRLIKLLSAFLILLAWQLGFATNQNEIASKVVQVSAVRINNEITRDKKAQVFMDLQNTGKIGHTLIAAYSPVADQVQIHEPEQHGKTIVMKQVNSLLIPAQKDEDLHYGGIHLMLIGMQEPLANHQEVPLTLIFSDGSWLSIDASVFSAPPTA